jgi:hypothetical protein
MKRLIGLLLVALALGACLRRTPSPTDTPELQTLPSPTSFPTSTPTLAGSSLPRITIVPSATRLQNTLQVESVEPSGTPTSRAPVPPTLNPTATPTETVVDASATATPQLSATAPPAETPLPTSTPAESPLPTPTAFESPLGSPPTATPSLASDGTGSTETPTATAEPSPVGQSLQFDKIFTHFDPEVQVFYVSGELVNGTGTYQHVSALMPVVLDEGRVPITSAEHVVAFPGYDELREAISLAPEQNLSFAFEVFLPEEVPVVEDYEILVEAEPADPPREDLDIIREDYLDSDWPEVFTVEGSFENPGPTLEYFAAVVVTVYDLHNDKERVVGVGWLYEDEELAFLQPGEHNFVVETELWDVIGSLQLDVYSYKVQVFGH